MKAISPHDPARRAVAARRLGMTARPIPQRHWRSYGTDPLPTGSGSPGRAVPGVPVVVHADHLRPVRPAADVLRDALGAGRHADPLRTLADTNFSCPYIGQHAFGHRTAMPHVFISYVRENGDAVYRLATELKSWGVTVWLDRNDIEPGARWQDAIKKAIRGGEFFLACFSKEFNERDRSYMNEELTLAIDELRQRPVSRTWFIPVLLNENCDPIALN